MSIMPSLGSLFCDVRRENVRCPVQEQEDISMQGKFSSCILRLNYDRDYRYCLSWSNRH
jgi:hypothetical protein